MEVKRRLGWAGDEGSGDKESKRQLEKKARMSSALSSKAMSVFDCIDPF